MWSTAFTLYFFGQLYADMDKGDSCRTSCNNYGLCYYTFKQFHNIKENKYKWGTTVIDDEYVILRDKFGEPFKHYLLNLGKVLILGFIHE